MSLVALALVSSAAPHRPSTPAPHVFAMPVLSYDVSIGPQPLTPGNVGPSPHLAWSARNDESPELRLLNYGSVGPVKPGDPRVSELRRILDSLDRKCTNSREEIGGLLVGIPRYLESKGIHEDLIAIARSLDSAVPAGAHHLIDFNRLGLDYDNFRTSHRPWTPYELRRSGQFCEVGRFQDGAASNFISPFLRAGEVGDFKLSPQEAMFPLPAGVNNSIWSFVYRVVVEGAAGDSRLRAIAQHVVTGLGQNQAADLLFYHAGDDLSGPYTVGRVRVRTTYVTPGPGWSGPLRGAAYMRP